MDLGWPMLRILFEAGVMVDDGLRPSQGWDAGVVGTAGFYLMEHFSFRAVRGLEVGCCHLEMVDSKVEGFLLGDRWCVDVYHWERLLCTKGGERGTRSK